VEHNRTTALFLLILLGVVLAFAYTLVRPFLQPLAFALVIGIGLYPVHLRIARLVSRKTLAALLSTLIVLLVFILPSFLIASAASRDLIRTAQYISTKSASEGGFIPYLRHVVDPAVSWLGKHIDLEETGLQQTLDAAPASISRFLLRVATSLVTGFAKFAGETLVMFFVLFFVFRDGASALTHIEALLPLDAPRSRRLLSGVRESVVANLYGILAVAAIQGSLLGIAMFVAGVSSPLLLGIAAAICSPIPFIGTALIWVPVAITQLVAGHWLTALLLTLWCSVVVGTADNVIRPLVIVGRVKLHPVPLVFGLIGGVKEFGIIGLFVGPVVMSLLLAIIRMLREEVLFPPTVPAPVGTAISVGPDC